MAEQKTGRRVPMFLIPAILVVVLALCGGLFLIYSCRAVSPTLPTTGPLAQSYQYDPNGNLISKTTPNGATIRYEYDALNRLIAVPYPDGSQVTYAYDERGNRTEMRDPLGVTRYRYDDLGQLIEVTDANGNTLKYEYDQMGNLTALSYPDGQKATYQYDKQGRLEKVTDSTGTTTYGYNDADEVVKRTLPNGVTTTCDFDSAGRLKTLRHSDSGNGLLVGVEYEFDAVGNRIQMKRTVGTGSPQVTRYEYDRLSRLVQVTYPDGEVVSYEYDTTGNRTSMKSSKQGATSQ